MNDTKLASMQALLFFICEIPDLTASLLLCTLVKVVLQSRIFLTLNYIYDVERLDGVLKLGMGVHLLLKLGGFMF